MVGGGAKVQSRIAGAGVAAGPRLAFVTAALTYYEVTKPRIWYLLVFTAVVAFVVGAGGQVVWDRLFAVAVAVALGGAGANTVTGYIDRDIDAVMHRTRLRPLPTGRIAPTRALGFGLTLAGASVALAWSLHWLAAAFMVIGLLDNIVVYSLLLKRRHPGNILLGGVSGAMPVLIGYAAAQPLGLSVEAVVMAMLVFLWIPMHIWSLAVHSRQDYARAKVPMLPVVLGELRAVRWIALTSFVLILFSLVPSVVGSRFGPLYVGTAVVLGLVMGVLNFWLFTQPTRDRAWTVFKFSSPYLALLFLAMLIDALV